MTRKTAITIRRITLPVTAATSGNTREELLDAIVDSIDIFELSAFSSGDNNLLVVKAEIVCALVGLNWIKPVVVAGFFEDEGTVPVDNIIFSSDVVVVAASLWVASELPAEFGKSLSVKARKTHSNIYVISLYRG